MNELQFAVVTDGLWRKSVSVIRALGKAGTHITVLGDSWATAGFWSRYTWKRRKAPLASDDPQAFGEALTRLAASEQPERALFPMEEASLQYVSDHREKLASLGYRFLIPSREALAIARNKASTIQFAAQLGLPAPRTLYPATFEEFKSAISQFERGAFVCKPTHGTGSAGVRYGDFADENEVARYWESQNPLVVQERVPADGRAIGVSLLFDDRSACVASFVHERLQQYPNSGGPSTDRVSIADPHLAELSTKLLSALGWKGIAMVEWKLDPVTSQPYIMEINPRFWGSLELAVRSGVNFPLLYLRVCEGQLIQPQPSYVLGVRCRWLVPGDLLRYLTAPSREPFPQFLRGLPAEAEEFDWRDLRGSFSVLLCTFLSSLQPRYWKYVRRR